MKTRNYTLLLHPAFLLALALLLLNDLYFKNAFHNGLTGKLSDFAGLFVFAVFLVAIIPVRSKNILLFGALFFCWWKSSLSDGLIWFFNHRFLLPVHRVVDYTDYTALLILPLAYRIKPPVYSIPVLRPILLYLSGIISFFAFCATSMPRYMQGGDTHINKTVRTRLPRAAIEEKFRQKNIPISRDTAYYTPLEPADKYLAVTDTLTGKKDTLHLSDHKEMVLYQRSAPYEPSYAIPYLLIRQDTLKNVRFSISEMENGKKRIIRLHSFLYDTIPPKGYFVSQYWLKRKYRKPLKNKIKEIVQ